MSLYQKIDESLKNALKTGDGFRVGVLRFILSVIRNKEIEKRSKGGSSILTDEEIIDVFVKEAKKRREAIDIYQKGSRSDLVQKETKELEIIREYLPKQLDEKEIEKIAVAAVKRSGATSVKEMGKAMAEAMKELRGRADAKLVGEVIKKLLS